MYRDILESSGCVFILGGMLYSSVECRAHMWGGGSEILAGWVGWGGGSEILAGWVGWGGSEILAGQVGCFGGSELH